MITPERIRELSAEARSNVETKANDKDDTRWWHPDHFDQEFARLIIREVASPELKKFIFDVWECCSASTVDDVKVGTYELLAESHEIAYRIVSHMEYVDEGKYYILDKVEDI